MWLSREQSVRTEEQQKALDEQTANLALYHYASCWFCGKVRGVIGQLGLNIELRDILLVPENRQVLIDNGGSSTVPCLRIEQSNGEVQWLYESADISRYLIERFADPR